MWIIYVLAHSSTKQIYIGKTNNLKRRLNEHNKGLQKATYRKSGLWKLVYAEVYSNKTAADIRELRLKTHGRAKQELFKRALIRNQSGAGRSERFPGDCLSKTQLPA